MSAAAKELRLIRYLASSQGTVVSLVTARRVAVGLPNGTSGLKIGVYVRSR
jgi:hypothetical protein